MSTLINPDQKRRRDSTSNVRRTVCRVSLRTATKAAVSENTQTKLDSLSSLAREAHGRNGVMCSDLLAENTSRAAALTTDYMQP